MSVNDLYDNNVQIEGYKLRKGIKKLNRTNTDQREDIMAADLQCGRLKLENNENDGKEFCLVASRLLDPLTVKVKDLGRSYTLYTVGEDNQIKVNGYQKGVGQGEISESRWSHEKDIVFSEVADQRVNGTSETGALGWPTTPYHVEKSGASR